MMYHPQKQLKSLTNIMNDFDEGNNISRDLSKPYLNRVVDTKTFLEVKATSIWNNFLYRQRQKNSPQTNKSNDSINIVVVFWLSILDLSHQTIELLISDPTISLESCVKVMSKNTSAVACTMNVKVTFGTIVEINSLAREKNTISNK